MTHVTQYMNGKEDPYISHLYYETNERILRKQVIQKEHYVGIDEVGCGSIAGALCVAAVVLPTNHTITELPIDSKLLSETDVDRLATEIRKQALLIEMVYVSPEGVSKKGVEKSRHLATKKVVQLIRKRFDDLLIQIDGEKKIKDVSNMKAVVRGDSKVANISAAAILAKCWSNHQMQVASQIYPGYGFEKNKGYPTNEHKIQLAKRGACEFHRKSLAERVTKKTRKERDRFLS